MGKRFLSLLLHLAKISLLTMGLSGSAEATDSKTSDPIFEVFTSILEKESLEKASRESFGGKALYEDSKSSWRFEILFVLQGQLEVIRALITEDPTNLSVSEGAFSSLEKTEACVNALCLAMNKSSKLKQFDLKKLSLYDPLYVAGLDAIFRLGSAKKGSDLALAITTAVSNSLKKGLPTFLRKIRTSISGDLLEEEPVNFRKIPTSSPFYKYAQRLSEIETQVFELERKAHTPPSVALSSPSSGGFGALEAAKGLPPSSSTPPLNFNFTFSFKPAPKPGPVVVKTSEKKRVVLSKPVQLRDIEGNLLKQFKNIEEAEGSVKSGAFFLTAYSALRIQSEALLEALREQTDSPMYTFAQNTEKRLDITEICQSLRSQTDVPDAEAPSGNISEAVKKGRFGTAYKAAYSTALETARKELAQADYFLLSSQDDSFNESREQIFLKILEALSSQEHIQRLYREALKSGVSTEKRMRFVLREAWKRLGKNEVVTLNELATSARIFVDLSRPGTDKLYLL